MKWDNIIIFDNKIMYFVDIIIKYLLVQNIYILLHLTLLISCIAIFSMH